MNTTANSIKGRFVSIKIILLSDTESDKLSRSLMTGELPPFSANELLINYLISQKDSDTIKILSPGTIVLTSQNSYNSEYFEKYNDMTYDEVISDLLLEFSHELLDNTRTGIIVSKIVTGDYDTFLQEYYENSEEINNSLIHLAYLYHIFYNNYLTTHGDPKPQSYTWLQLSKPIDIEYDFRDEYDSSNSRIIRRRNVKHIFFFTNLQFAFSPIIHRQFDKYFNLNNVLKDGTILVPRISAEQPYKYNENLYNGYHVKMNQLIETENTTLFDWYEPIFPRMFTIDIMVLVKMLLTYWYSDSLDSNLVRKLHMFFTKFISLSMSKPSEMDYLKVSPSSFAMLINFS